MDQDIVIIPSNEEFQDNKPKENPTPTLSLLVDPSLGSFICIPSPEQSNKKSKEESLMPPYELVSIGNLSEPVLLIPDYQCLQPHSERHTIHKSQNTVPFATPTQSTNTASHSQSHQSPPPLPPLPVDPQSDSVIRHLAEPDLSPLEQVTEKSPISALKKSDEFHVTQLQRHAYIMTVSELATFPADYPGMYALLKSTGSFPFLDAMITEAQSIVLKHRASGCTETSPGVAEGNNDARYQHRQ